MPTSLATSTVPRYIRQSWQRPPNKRLIPKLGDYVLATKYYDGDPGDHFCIGTYSGSFMNGKEIRYLVADNNGDQFRHNGFRRCQRISIKRGKWLVSHLLLIESMKDRFSVWHWYRITWKELELYDTDCS